MMIQNGVCTRYATAEHNACQQRNQIKSAEMAGAALPCFSNGVLQSFEAQWNEGADARAAIVRGAAAAAAMEWMHAEHC